MSEVENNKTGDTPNYVLLDKYWSMSDVILKEKTNENNK